MSRIGRTPIAVPAGVTVTIDASNLVTVKGPKGELSRTIHKDMILKLEDSVLTVDRPSDQKEHRSLHGLSRTLISNMVVGVTQVSRRLWKSSALVTERLKPATNWL